MKLFLLVLLSFSFIAQAREVCNSVPIGLDNPDGLACNQPVPKPKPKKYVSLDHFVKHVNNVMYCFSGSESQTDTSNQSCLIVENRKFYIRHSGATDWFAYMGTNWHPKIQDKILGESYGFDFKTKDHIPEIKINKIRRLKAVVDKVGDEPDWYLKELAMCRSKDKACNNNVGYFNTWLNWFSYVAADDLYYLCETGKLYCIERAKKRRLISEKMIYQGMSKSGSSGPGGSNPPGSGGGGGISAPIAGGSGNSCWGWNSVCIRNECVRRWQERKCD